MCGNSAECADAKQPQEQLHYGAITLHGLIIPAATYTLTLPDSRTVPSTCGRTVTSLLFGCDHRQDLLKGLVLQIKHRRLVRGDRALPPPFQQLQAQRTALYKQLQELQAQVSINPPLDSRLKLAA